MYMRFLLALAMVLGLALSADGASKKFTLVIDPGHGGKDAGALGSFSKEKNVALSVALAFGRYVENNCPDVKVIYTRKTDVFIPLEQRANIANRNKADLFVSIHCNALPNHKISRGMETYTLGMHRAQDNFDVAKRENEVILYEKDYKQRYAGFDPRSSESYIMFELLQDNNMQQSVEMARLVQKNVCGSLGRPNKGVKQAGFLVLRETSMPSCLVELGFITTPDEERLMNDRSKQDAMGRGLYNAFVAYKRKVAPGVAVPYKPQPQEPKLPQVVPAKEETPQQLSKPQPDKQVDRQTEVQPEQKQPEPKQEPVAQPAITPLMHPTDPSQGETTPAENQNQQQQQEHPLQQQPPVFKVQILASGTRLAVSSPQFKNHSAVDCYEEQGMYKYTIGASADYREIYQLRKSLLADFPQSFIIAFRGSDKMDVNEAIREYKENKNKK